MIAVIAGRLVPGYTRAMLIPVKAPRDALRERASIVLLLLMTGADAAGLLQGIRLAGWRSRDALSHPLLLVLHIGFAWLAIGLALRGIADLFGALPRIDALHAITLGAMGTLTLGMMVRLTRTHGRLGQVSDAPTNAAFVAMSAAALLRVFGPLVAPGAPMPVYLAAGALWIGAFVIFLIRYAPAGRGQCP